MVCVVVEADFTKVEVNDGMVKSHHVVLYE